VGFTDFKSGYYRQGLSHDFRGEDFAHPFCSFQKRKAGAVSGFKCGGFARLHFKSDLAELFKLPARHTLICPNWRFPAAAYRKTTRAFTSGNQGLRHVVPGDSCPYTQVGMAAGK
ncbi:hypothetical protein D3Z44_17620, partial [Lachnospiraceae bacterium]|nr:hypothetical protein [Lachnospiraceae bacterium]